MKRFRLALGWLLPLFVAVAGCDWFEDPSPEIIRVTLDGSADQFVIITSTEFFAATNEAGEVGVQVFNPDTTIVSLPFEQTWDISQAQRFLLLGMPGDSSAVTVRLRVLIDGDESFDQTVLTLIDDPVRFVYLFNQQILQDFELL